MSAKERYRHYYRIFQQRSAAGISFPTGEPYRRIAFAADGSHLNRYDQPTGWVNRT